ncbi:MAG: SLC13 family permease [Pseudomonadales bacterium]|jgi:Na+/H+ antiporter NhaD/arsenite permease-like protein
MLVSGIILAATFIGIFTEKFHNLDRVRFAMAGAGAMIVAGQILGFYGPVQALESIDWNVVFLLGCMMSVVAIMLPTGGFDALAFRMAHWSRGRLYLLLVLIGSAVTGLSLLLDNVTTVVIFAPLIILITQALEVSPVPYLLAAALLSDTGGVATLVGDPPNLMIGSAAGIDFNTFVIHMGGVVVLCWLATLLILRVMFRKELTAGHTDAEFPEHYKVADPRTWHAALISLGLTCVLFLVHGALDWEPWVAAAAGFTLLVFLAPGVKLDAAYERVEIALLTFFISLFVLIGGVEQSHFLEYLGQFIEPLVQQDLMVSTIILMWVAAVLSAMIDNIPFTAAMIPIIHGMELQGINVTPLWWGLAVGVGMGGNGTHVGSTANVYIVTVSERLARDKNDPSLAITPGVWFRKGTPAMLLTLVVATIVFVLFFEFFSAPLNAG